MRFRKSSRARAPREPRFWDRQPFADTSQNLSAARQVSAAIVGQPKDFVASAAGTEQDFTLMVLKLGLVWVFGHGGAVGAGTIAGDVYYGVYIDDVDSAVSRDPYINNIAGNQGTDWMYLGHFCAQFETASTGTRGLLSKNHGSLPDDTITVKSRRRVEANQAVFLSWTWFQREGVATTGTTRLMGTASGLWQRSMRKR